MSSMQELDNETYIKKEETYDPVNRPQHYCKNGVECIDILRQYLSHDEFIGYLKGNVFKYQFRYKDKGTPIQDLEKALWYLNYLKTLEENFEINRFDP